MLGMKMPDYFPRASENVANAISIIQALLEKGIAYRNKRNIYFDPLKFPGFGKLYGLDMGKWPKRKRRFHLDTYPGMRWNLGDFILWHGCRAAGTGLLGNPGRKRQAILERPGPEHDPPLFPRDIVNLHGRDR